MPLQNRKEDETPQLHGVNLAVDSSKMQLGWFERLQNWIPSKRLKLKKKRGVDDVPSAEQFFTVSPCDTATNLGAVCDLICPLGQFAEAVYSGASLPGGPAIRVTIDSTEELFVGLAAIYIPDQTGIALTLFNGPIDTLGTVVATIGNTTLVEGDVLRLEADLTTLGSYNVKINDVLVLNATISTATLNPANPCVSFIGLASVPPDTIPAGSGGEDADVVIVKATPENRTSDSTPSNDADFSFAIGANETWVVIMMLDWTAGNTAQIGFVGPTGCTGKIWDDEYAFNSAALGSFLNENLGGGVPIKVSASIVNGSTAGNINFQWAQVTPSGTTTTLGANSHMVGFKKV